MNADPTSLDRLHDVIAPPGAPLWPPAPGWIALGCILSFLLCVGIARLIHAWQQNRYRRDALSELRMLQHDASHKTTLKNVPAAIATIIKRTALTVWPREEVASLAGPAWWRFLDQSCEAGGFAPEIGPILDRSIYDDDFGGALVPEEVNKLFAAAEYWIEHHERELIQC